VYILQDTVLATDVNKYSLTTASCQQRRQTNWIHLDLLLGVKQRTVGCFGLPITTKQQPWFRQSANHGIMVLCWPSVGGYHLLVEPLATNKLQSLAPLCVQRAREGSDFSVVYRRSAEVLVGS